MPEAGPESGQSSAPCSAYGTLDQSGLSWLSAAKSTYKYFRALFRGTNFGLISVFASY